MQQRCLVFLLVFVYFTQLVGGHQVWASNQELNPDRYLVMVNQYEGALFDQFQDMQFVLGQLWPRLLDQGLIHDQNKLRALKHALDQELNALPQGQGAYLLDAKSIHLIKARRAYFQFAFQQCIQELEEARLLLNRNLDDRYMPNFFPYERALLHAMCHMAKGDAQEADLQFKEAIRLRPKMRLNGLAFSPETKARYNRLQTEYIQAQFQTPKSKQRAISVQSTPPFAEVYFNGKRLGKTPMTIGDLPEGPHYLKINKEGYWPSYQRIYLKGTWLGQTKVNLNKKPGKLETQAAQTALHTFHHLNLEPIIYVSSVTRSDPFWLQEVRKLAEVHSSRLMMIGLKKVQWNVQVHIDLIDLDSGQLLKTLNQEFFELKTEFPKEADAMVLALAKTQTNKVPRVLHALKRAPMIAQMTEKKPEVRQPPIDIMPQLRFDETELNRFEAELIEERVIPSKKRAHKKQWYQSWWFWSLVAVAAAGAAGGSVVALNGNSSGGSVPPVTPSINANNAKGVVVSPAR